MEELLGPPSSVPPRQPVKAPVAAATSAQGGAASSSAPKQPSRSRKKTSSVKSNYIQSRSVNQGMEGCSGMQVGPPYSTYTNLVRSASQECLPRPSHPGQVPSRSCNYGNKGTTLGTSRCDTKWTYRNGQFAWNLSISTTGQFVYPLYLFLISKCR